MPRNQPEARGRRRPRPIAIEALETRHLLSTATTSQTISSGHANFNVAVTGPGTVSIQKAAKGQFAIELSGTTVGSVVTVIQKGQTTQGFSGAGLPVARIDVASGTVGQFNGLGTVNLLGTLKLKGAGSSIQLASIGPAAKINAPGGLAALTVSGGIDLGPTGRINVGGDLTGTLQAGSINLQGGQILVSHNLGNLTAGSFTATANGLFLVGNDVGTVAVTGSAYLARGGSLAIGEDAQSFTVSAVTIDPGGRVGVGRDLLSSLNINGNLAINAGQFIVGRNVTGAMTIDGDLSAAHGGNLTVGRDLSGGLNVAGDVDLVGGSLDVGRDVNLPTGTSNNGGVTVVSFSSVAGTAIQTGLTVQGNLVIASGGAIVVGGNLDGLGVLGTVQGSGTDAVDITVGLDLNNFTVNGGSPGLGGVNGLNLAVAKNIDGLSVAHGLFNDFITAGVLLTNVNVGADGPVAVDDTEIRAGVQITNVALDGQVISDRPTNPLGRRTRIIAGEDRAGDFIVGGNIGNFIITGSLINAAVVADVQPYGGTGAEQLTPNPAPAAGALDYYDAPGKLTYVQQFGANAGIPFAAPPFNTVADPTVHDTVLPGSINKSFYVAPTVTTSSAGVTTTTVNPPSTSSALGGVFTTGHANDSDYAGFFAADTTGVYAGSLPG